MHDQYAPYSLAMTAPIRPPRSPAEHTWIKAIAAEVHKAIAQRHYVAANECK